MTDSNLLQIVGFANEIADDDIFYLIKKVDGAYKDRKMTGDVLSKEVLRITGISQWRKTQTVGAGTWSFALGASENYSGAVITFSFEADGERRIGQVYVVTNGTVCRQNTVTDYETGDIGVDFPFESALSANQLTFRFICEKSVNFTFRTQLIPRA